MSKTFFYSHLVEIESLLIKLEELDLSSDQKTNLTSIIDSSIHHTILDAILSELSQEDKKIFLGHLKEEDEEKIWKFLSEKIDNIEDKIKTVSKELTVKLHEDLKDAKEHSHKILLSAPEEK